MNSFKTSLLLVILLCGIAPAQKQDIRVGTYYYPWYGPTAHPVSKSLRYHLVPKQPAQLGKYDSRAVSVISDHIDMSHRANIHFWVVSWWGPGRYTDSVFKNYILKHSRAGELKYAAFYESKGRLGDFDNPNYANLLPDFDYLAANYFDNPNYLKINGKPVVLIYISRVYFNQTQGYQQLAALRAAHPNLYLVADDVNGSFNAARASKYEAVCVYGVYGKGRFNALGSTQAALNQLKSTYDRAKRNCNSVGVGFVPAAGPGYNDKVTREGNNGMPRYLEDDPDSAEGDLFKKMLRDVVVPNHVDPLAENMLVITSFNEWHEDSQIEPTEGTSGTTVLDDSSLGTDYTQGDRYTDYGYLYIDILRQETCRVLGDLDHNYRVDMEDFSLFALRWMDIDCDDCDGSDLNGDGTVNTADLEMLSRNWLTEKCYTHLPYSVTDPRR